MWNKVYSEKNTNGNLLDYGTFSRKLTNITDFSEINFSLITVRKTIEMNRHYWSCRAHRQIIDVCINMWNSKCS